MALYMPLLMTSGFTHKNPFLKSFVIGVSTNPGLMVNTCTLDFDKRLRKPCKNIVNAPFAVP